MFEYEFLILVFFRVYCVIATWSISVQIWDVFKIISCSNSISVIFKRLKTLTFKEIAGLSLFIASIFSWFMGW